MTPSRVLFLLPFLALRASAADPLPGHSVHGEVFNEGPRQEAHLMAGTGAIAFPVTTESKAAQQFFTQGVGQLHGFWFFEAERSFRQAAKFDPNCAMAYWGMTMANANNDKRARGFLAKASALKDKASAKEKRWIEILEKFYREDKEDKRDKKQRATDFIADLDALVVDYPDDVEAKAFLAWKIWHVKGEVPITSHMAVNALLDQVFAANPKHPAHHYRIHLWDNQKPAQALRSAAACGPAAPGIAHMWHMPGHTYSKLKRYDDAAWQQEASTRVDHAYMMQNLILPDQIHNYAHNEEWLVRTFNELGQFRKALFLAQSLIRNPRHPAYNTLDKSGCSATHGRNRLIETLVKWQQWDQLLAHADGPYLPAVIQPALEVPRLKALGLAHFAQANPDALGTVIDQLAKLDQKEADKAQRDAAKKPEAAAQPKEEIRKAVPAGATPAKKAAKPTEATPSKTAANKAPAKPKPRASETALAELRALHAVLTKAEDAAAKLEAAKDLDKVIAAEAWLRLDKQDKAIELAKNFPQDLAGNSAKAVLLHRCGQIEEARKAFDLAHAAAFAMEDSLPAAKDLQRLAQAFGVKKWKAAPPKRDDVGERPPLESLGPMFWQPPVAPSWTVTGMDGQTIQNGTTPDAPQLLVFYLGSECGHCVEQLNAIAKHYQAFVDAGIALHAISPQTPEAAVAVRGKLQLGQGPKGLAKADDLPLFSDPGFAAFKAFRAFDDFEGDALHGVVLIDSKRRIRWIDTSYQPFMDIPFLLAEAKRQLQLEALSKDADP